MVEGEQEVVAALGQRLKAGVVIVREQAAVERARMGLDPAQPAREERQGEGVERRDGDRLLARPGGRLQGGPAGVQHPHGLLGRLAKITASGRQRGRIGGTVDEGDAEPRFECPDPAAEGGLGEMALLGRAREAARPRQADEILKPLELHERNT